MTVSTKLREGRKSLLLFEPVVILTIRIKNMVMKTLISCSRAIVATATLVCRPCLRRKFRFRVALPTPAGVIRLTKEVAICTKKEFLKLILPGQTPTKARAAPQ